jgi:hypothetical protein
MTKTENGHTERKRKREKRGITKRHKLQERGREGNREERHDKDRDKKLRQHFLT